MMSIMQKVCLQLKNNDLLAQNHANCEKNQFNSKNKD